MLALSRLIRSSIRDERGVAAIEFALVAPILFILYFMTMEVSQAIETNKKIGRISSMVGDLVAQQRNSVTREAVDGILDIGAAIVQPYGRSRPTIVVEHIQIEDKANPKAFVTWSRKLQGSTKGNAVPRNSETQVPEELLERGRNLVRVTTRLDYRPVITWTAEQKTSLGLVSAFDHISMSEFSYLRPRSGGAITCTNCP